MDRTGLYKGILESYASEIENEEIGNYTNFKYKLLHTDSMLNLMQDIINSDRDLDPRYWASLGQRCRILRDKITIKLSALEAKDYIQADIQAVKEAVEQHSHKAN